MWNGNYGVELGTTAGRGRPGPRDERDHDDQSQSDSAAESSHVIMTPPTGPRFRHQRLLLAEEALDLGCQVFTAHRTRLGVVELLELLDHYLHVGSVGDHLVELGDLLAGVIL